jgi:hypothetical protein
VFIHGVIEWVAQTSKGVKNNRLMHVVWHLRLDITLVVFALWLGVYLESIFGILGIAQGAKAGVHTLSKFAAWQNSIKAVLLSLDDVAQVGKAIVTRKKQPTPIIEENGFSSKVLQIKLWDKVLLFAFIMLILSIVFAPYLASEVSYGYVLNSLINDLKPFPNLD